jgi:clan AA aspartic protease
VVSGIINSDLEAIVRLWIRGPLKEIEAEAIVDTGFNGTLVLSPELIAELGLSLKGRGRGVLANGGVISFPLYEALVFWNGRLLEITVGATETRPFIGMSLLPPGSIASSAATIRGPATSASWRSLF